MRDEFFIKKYANETAKIEPKLLSKVYILFRPAKIKDVRTALRRASELLGGDFLPFMNLIYSDTYFKKARGVVETTKHFPMPKGYQKLWAELCYSARDVSLGIMGQEDYWDFVSTLQRKRDYSAIKFMSRAISDGRLHASAPRSVVEEVFPDLLD